MQFVKADACGNDFLIVEGQADAALAIALCQRHTGVGADGVEFLERTGPHSGVIRLVNADGSIAEISGNGTRCVAAWIAHESHAQPGDTITLTTDAGPRACRVVSAEGAKFLMATGMGVPAVRHGMVMLPQGIVVQGYVVHTGNPHFVIEVQSGDFTVQGHDWREIGKAICFHPDFPAQTNVEFVHIIDTNTIAIRIYERGVGPTTSSGTGTCASAAATIAAGRAASPLRVIAEGGEQRVEWAGEGAEITLTGPAELICQGEAFVG
jgi:diaminopimelate epimerase